MAKSTKILLIVLGVVVFLVAAVVIWGISTYNTLVSLEENVNTYKSNIDADLQRRVDLIPNLVETVKGYAAHEEEIFTAVADARSKLMSASGVEEESAANAELDSALSRLLMIAEDYPELKANENFINLQDELAGTENRIKVARVNYNDAVQKYNTRLRKFPSSIIAGMFGFERAELFEATDNASSVPQVSF